MLVSEFWKIPFLRLIIPFIAGIVISSYFNISTFFLLVSSLLFIVLTIIYRPIFDNKLSYHKRWIFGFLLTLALVFSGAYITKKSMFFDQNILKSQQVIGIIDEPPKIGAYSIKIKLKVIKQETNNVWLKSNSKLLVNLEKDSSANLLRYGDLILMKGNLKEITNAGNPSEFDYKKYLSRKHIHFKSYQNSEQWVLLEKNKGNPVFSYSYIIREKLLNIYNETGIKGEEFGLLAALTLGTMDYLSDEIIEAYSDSGAMHVLSVSGLHVGIIFIVLNQLLFFMRKNRYMQVLQAILIILAIWAYAILTGLSPAVNRSAAMITFVIIGKVSQKKPSIYNTVMASAFILLFIEPLTLFDVGFQLSYLAVLSIIFFQERIYLLYEPKNWLIDKIWSLTTVSIAAQIGTSTLSIFYFHQFPVYAVFTNLFVVPVSFVVMVLAIALLFCSFILPLAKLIGITLSATIKVLNSSTKFIENLPLSTIEPISMNSVESLLLHCALVLILIFIVTKNKKLAPAILFTFILAFGFRDFRFIKHKNTSSITVFNVPKKSALSVIQNGNLVLYSDSSLHSDKKAVNYLTSNIMADKFVSNISLSKFETVNKNDTTYLEKEILKYLICMDSLKVLYLMEDYSQLKCRNKLRVNYLILTKNTIMDIEQLQALFDFEMIIADASVPNWKQEVLKRDCQQLEIPFYNVSESGAFIHQIHH